ncbi:hypothetical protein [Aureivirga sp. CE67]|uniref:hypothetical protein n=1 Tax=Aureivirga sp. CE67 TaxID=1788983 RepID=UPI001E3D81EB|nr:hypothetical protein [Aureivirga sp. CE67]
MINMNQLHSKQNYKNALISFNNSTHEKRWKIFKDSHMEVSKGRCPICECLLDGQNIRPTNSSQPHTLIATIDHYRPQSTSMYPKLKYDHLNYLLMCSDCNNVYKENFFPLYSNGNRREQNVSSTACIKQEKPLIVNPIYDIPFNLFKIQFKIDENTSKKVLELSPKHQNGYLYEKAKTTITFFSLGSPKNTKNPNVENFRVLLLNKHYNAFKNILFKLNGRKLDDLVLNDQKSIYSIIMENNLNNFGFLKSILLGEYEDFT